MDKEEQSKKLMGMIKDLSQTQENELDLMIGIFNRNINEMIENYMKKISEDFSSKCKFYERQERDVEEIRKEIFGAYEREFERISDRFQEQYINIIYEIQEAQMNQMIMITNYKKMLELKVNFKESKEYQKYRNKVEELTIKRDNSETKESFDRFDNALKVLENPIISYENKIDLYVKKYGGYCALEEECYKKLEECSSHIKNAIDSVMKYDKGWLEVQKKVNFFGFFSKLINKFVGAKKFEKEFVNIKKQNIKMIIEDTDKLIEEIRKDTVDHIDIITIQKNQIKQDSSIVA